MMACWILSLLLAAPAGGPAPLPLPFRESFNGSSLDPAWTVDASAGNTISVGAGQLDIRAHINTFAHIERPLGQDFVRVSCALKGDGGVSWCTSLFIYWDAGQWVQLGVVPDGDGQIYLTEMNAGSPREQRLGACAYADWQWVAIELAADCIRYRHSTDGEHWATLLVGTRPRGADRVPSLLAIGRGYGRGHGQHAAKDLDNNYTDPGPMSLSHVRDIRIERLDWAAMRATDEERAARAAQGRDLVAEKELAGDADPSFESVARHFPAMKFPREVVGVKDHPHDIGVAWDGALQLNDVCNDAQQPIAYFEIGDPPQRFGSGPVPCRKRLLDGHLPVVMATHTLDGWACEQTVLGWSEGMSPDAPLYAYVRLDMANTAATPREARVRFVHQAKGKNAAAGEWTMKLAPAAHESLCLKVPFDAGEAKVSRIDPPAFDERLQQTRAYWRDLLAAGERFSVPEPRVQDAYRAWLAYSFLNVDKRKDVYHICDGAGFYEEIYGYSAALYCHVLDLLGYHEQARIYLDSLLTFQQKDGLFYVNFGHTDTGTLLHVMAMHYRITGDAAWLRRVSPNMIAMCNWIIARRPESMKHTHGRRALVHGLIRFRPYCDYELPAYDYYSNSYLCTGMAETADVLKDIGMTDEAARLARESSTYRQDILTSMDAAIIDHEGVRMLPLMPDTQFLLKESNYTANGYYGLVASCLLEAGVLAADDPRADLVVDMLESHGGLLAGQCQFFGQIDHAYTYGYWLNCLERNEPRKAILGLYGSMAYGMTRETYSGVECTSIRTGENAHTLPHQYSCSKQLRLLRNMLLREQGDELLVGQAIPRTWLEPGKIVEVKQSPTLFGPLSYRMAPSADGRSIRVQIDPPTRCPPKSMRIWLREPGKRPIASIRTEPNADLAHEADSIQWMRPTGPVTMDITYKE